MYTSEEFHDQSIEFSCDDSDYIWYGDYRVESFDEDGDYDSPPHGETKVRLIHTIEFLKANEEGNYELIVLDFDMKRYVTEHIKESL
jgi:hypothetical protein